MKLIDTHTHIYLEDFDADKDEVVQRAINNGVTQMLLPNIDKDSVTLLLEFCANYPDNCYPMIGLHPTSVKDDYREQLRFLEKTLIENKFVAIGEIGLDFYWDKTYYEQQFDAFRTQVNWAKQHHLPVAVHTRNAFPQILDELEALQDGNLRGVLHCFSGTYEEAQRALALGFYLGIGGVLTYKKSTLPDIVKKIPIERLLLETDAPFLPPVPYRGKRNEPAYLIEIAKKIAEVKETDLETVAYLCTENSKKLFLTAQNDTRR
ncbi:MAG: TatD family hydrolase [Lentimicrobiaceae bacterium]|jgi:TatD DNase family protein|nr:TatD family hydrolase [Lentimicrobiaceae bacterium]